MLHTIKTYRNIHVALCIWSLFWPPINHIYPFAYSFNARYIISDINIFCPKICLPSHQVSLTFSSVYVNKTSANCWYTFTINIISSHKLIHILSKNYRGLIYTSILSKVYTTSHCTVLLCYTKKVICTLIDVL